jgi:hypothetical protein
MYALLRVIAEFRDWRPREKTYGRLDNLEGRVLITMLTNIVGTRSLSSEFAHWCAFFALEA